MNPYADRKTLRRLESAWTRLEILANRLWTADFNPFYHLGTLAIYLLIVITITGLYLTVLYRPGAEVAYASVERISSGWFGSLMRTVHRYASDAFLLVVVLHALKTFLSDRFWGSRWLAWLSGWGMVLTAWFLGTMGYWLVWDERAQWLTEHLIRSARGPVALTFLNADIASSTFVAFVIVLFVHIFLPLALLGLIIVHNLRLARPRIWSPRWVAVLSTIALIAVSVIVPAVSAAPADLGRLLVDVELDGWYLGFMPVLDRLGALPAWGSAFALFGVAMAMPWLARGQDAGPATIQDANCSGCALCAVECPYRAIEMHYRSDDHARFRSIAVINADLCTGCGLCVGTCATLGVELDGLPTDLVYANGLIPAVRAELDAGTAPVVVFTCHRQSALGGLDRIGEALSTGFPGGAVDQAPPVRTGERAGRRVVTLEVACLGMVDVDWVKEMYNLGVKDVVLLGCPFDDCIYREGPVWSSLRLSRRKSLVRPNLHWLETAPGNRTPLDNLLDRLAATNERTKPDLPHPKERQRRMPKFSWGAGLVLFFTALFGLSALPVVFPASVAGAAEAELRIVVEHKGVAITALGPGVELPEGAVVDPAQLGAGGNFPVEVEVYLDGERVLAETFKARGLRQDGGIAGFVPVPVAPGEYQLEIRIRDDGETWRTVFSGAVVFEEARVETFVYDQQLDEFTPR
ncbi:MAG TPA: cytochrome b N-terminal domain-containing protein [Anaerolineales bacterium]|nr:cytochrome b N-terminal domain-containing protein [Anaerolineales bacterium]